MRIQGNSSSLLRRCWNASELLSIIVGTYRIEYAVPSTITGHTPVWV